MKKKKMLTFYAHVLDIADEKARLLKIATKKGHQC